MPPRLFRVLLLTLSAQLLAGCGAEAGPTPVVTSPTVAAVVATGPRGERVADQGRDHIEPGQPHPEYNSVPATSGWHYGHPNGPAAWGVYRDAIPDEVLVHNLEHGGIGVHYDCPERCVDLVVVLEDTVARMLNAGEKVVVSPYPGLGTRIALTAWTFLDRFEDFEEERIVAFIHTHESSQNAPEALVR